MQSHSVHREAIHAHRHTVENRWRGDTSVKRSRGIQSSGRSWYPSAWRVELGTSLIVGLAKLLLLLWLLELLVLLLLVLLDLLLL